MAAWLPIAEIASKVQAGQLKAVDLVEQALTAIEAKKDFNAVLWSLEARARERALAIDKLVADGQKAGRLAGVPFIAKDNFLVFGAETTAASNIANLRIPNSFCVWINLAGLRLPSGAPAPCRP